MRKVSKCVILLLFLSACDPFAGNYCAIGENSLGSTTHVGCLSRVEGRVIAHGRAVGETQNLLYLMIICPGLKAASSLAVGGGIEGDPMSEPFIYYDWDTTSGMVRVSVNWKTSSDVISIGQKNFRRADGNVFLIERSPNGDLVAKQCGLLGPKASFADAARLIRQKLPDDELVRSVRFRTLDE